MPESTGFSTFDPNAPKNQAEVKKAAANAPFVPNPYFPNATAEDLARYKKFFEELAKIFGAHPVLPKPCSVEFKGILDHVVGNSSIGRKPTNPLAFSGAVEARPYFLDSKGDANIRLTRDSVSLRKNVPLTAEKAFTMALLIYVNPNAQNGVKLTGTPEEKLMLQHALDKVMSLHPDRPKIQIFNRVDPAAFNPTGPAPAEGADAAQTDSIQPNQPKDTPVAQTSKQPVKLHTFHPNETINGEVIKIISDGLRADAKALGAEGAVITDDAINGFWDSQKERHGEIVEAARKAALALSAEQLALINQDPEIAQIVANMIKNHADATSLEVYTASDILEFWNSNVSEQERFTQEAIVARDEARQAEATARAEAEQGATSLDSLAATAGSESESQVTTETPSTEAKPVNAANGNGKEIVIDKDVLDKVRTHIVTTQNASLKDIMKTFHVDVDTAKGFFQCLEGENVIGIRSKQYKVLAAAADFVAAANPAAAAEASATLETVHPTRVPRRGGTPTNDKN